MDLYGPSICASLSGKYYAFVIVDEYSLKMFSVKMEMHLKFSVKMFKMKRDMLFFVLEVIMVEN